MSPKRLEMLLTAVRDRDVSVREAIERLSLLPYEELDYARIDHHRALRTGTDEVVFCEGKSPAQVVEILRRMAVTSGRAFGTRATSEQLRAVGKQIPDARIHEIARCISLGPGRANDRPDAVVLVVCAGTADLPVAEEACATAEYLGCSTDRLFDVGVAGIHRLLDQRERLSFATVVIVIAGMEGALPSVVGGLVSSPVIAVPTSVGYGASFQGLAALLAMLNSCAPGVGVVNIDNGFGAAVLASRILGGLEFRKGNAS